MTGQYNVTVTATNNCSSIVTSRPVNVFGEVNELRLDHAPDTCNVGSVITIVAESENATLFDWLIEPVRRTQDDRVRSACRVCRVGERRHAGMARSNECAHVAAL